MQSPCQIPQTLLITSSSVVVVAVDLVVAVQVELSKEITLQSHRHPHTQLSLVLEEMLVKVETMAEPTQQMVVNHLSQQLACSVAVPVVREIK
jgi:hypothetical protein